MSLYATIILTHGDLGRSLVKTTEDIVGEQKNVFIFSNKKDSLSVLTKKIMTCIGKSSAEKIILFTDLKGGSCWHIGAMLKTQNDNITIISGVNMPMLVTYFSNIYELNFDELIRKTVHDGCRGIEIAGEI